MYFKHYYYAIYTLKGKMSNNKTPENPFAFSYNIDTGFTFLDDFGAYYVFPDEIERGCYYLNMRVSYVKRSHEDETDDCSSYNFEDADNNELKKYSSEPVELKLFFKVPAHMYHYLSNKDTCNRKVVKILNKEYFNNKWELNKDYDDVCMMYSPWITPSWCNGNGKCHLYDSYEVKNFKFVRIV